MVLDKNEVLKQFEAKGAVIMRADITNEQPIAQALLKLVEGNQIPYLAIFPGDKLNEPRVLEDFNPFNPGDYRGRLYSVLAGCPDPPRIQTAQAR